MAKYHRFEDLPAWQEAAILYNCVQDLLDEGGTLLSSGFRNQLDRAALSITNNIAEGFERSTTSELLSFLAIAKGSAGEVRSMIAVIKGRPKLRPVRVRLEEIGRLAESCSRQLMAWIASVEIGSVKGKRHKDGAMLKAENAERAAREFRTRFLRTLQPGHALYTSTEARIARGELPAEE